MSKITFRKRIRNRNSPEPYCFAWYLLINGKKLDAKIFIFPQSFLGKCTYYIFYKEQILRESFYPGARQLRYRTLLEAKKGLVEYFNRYEARDF